MHAGAARFWPMEGHLHRGLFCYFPIHHSTFDSAGPPRLADQVTLQGTLSQGSQVPGLQTHCRLRERVTGQQGLPDGRWCPPVRDVRSQALVQPATRNSVSAPLTPKSPPSTASLCIATRFGNLKRKDPAADPACDSTAKSGCSLVGVHPASGIPAPAPPHTGDRLKQQPSTLLFTRHIHASSHCHQAPPALRACFAAVSTPSNVCSLIRA